MAENITEVVGQKVNERPTVTLSKELLALIANPTTGATAKATLEEVIKLFSQNLPPSTAATTSLLIPRGVAPTIPQEGLSNHSGKIYFNGEELATTNNTASFIRLLTSADNIENIKETGIYILYESDEPQGLPAAGSASFYGVLVVEKYGVYSISQSLYYYNGSPYGAEGGALYKRLSTGQEFSNWIKATLTT